MSLFSFISCDKCKLSFLWGLTGIKNIFFRIVSYRWAAILEISEWNVVLLTMIGANAVLVTLLRLWIFIID